jgi:hypothetical protein
MFLQVSPQLILKLDTCSPAKARWGELVARNNAQGLGALRAGLGKHQHVSYHLKQGISPIMTSLRQAVAQNDRGLVLKILAEGANVNAADRRGRTV